MNEDNSIRAARISNKGVIIAAIIAPVITFALGYFSQAIKTEEYKGLAENYKVKIEQMTKEIETANENINSNTNTNINTTNLSIDGKNITSQEYFDTLKELSDYIEKYKTAQSKYEEVNLKYQELEQSYIELCNSNSSTATKSTETLSTEEPLSGILLSSLKPFTSPYAGYYKIVNNITDAEGFLHSESIKLVAVRDPDSYIKKEPNILEFKVDGNYSTFTGTLSFYEERQVNADLYLAIYADGINVKTTETVNRKSGSKDFEADISGAQYIEIIAGYTGDFSRYDSALLLSNAILK